jgi:hypothetical protein
MDKYVLTTFISVYNVDKNYDIYYLIMDKYELSTFISVSIERSSQLRDTYVLVALCNYGRQILLTQTLLLQISYWGVVDSDLRLPLSSRCSLTECCCFFYAFSDFYSLPPDLHYTFLLSLMPSVYYHCLRCGANLFIVERRCLKRFIIGTNVRI